MFNLFKPLRKIGQDLASAFSALTSHTNSIATINGKLNDYIVEQGTSGIWTYRKWASGIAECWGKVPFTNLAINTRNFGTYYSNAFLYDFPFTFYEIPIPLVQSYNAGTWTSISSTNTSRLGFRLNRNESGTLTDTAFVIVKGLWKAFEQVGGVILNYLNSLRVRWQYV